MRSDLLVVFIFLFFVFPAAAIDNATQTPQVTIPSEELAPYTIRLFIPESGSVHSDQIKDLISGPKRGDAVIATAFGLSIFNGTWDSRHMYKNNLSEGLMDDFLTAVEYDISGNLWIGYNSGIQIYNGVYYNTIRDQQLLKELQIRDLQRWNDDMWVATGHSGIHRFRNGTWTWFQPMTQGGPEFYEVNDMVLDSSIANSSMVIATNEEGLWIIKSPDDPVAFTLLAAGGEKYGGLEHVRRDPLGGVYFFNSSMVVHYSKDKGFVPVLTAGDLSNAQISINDITAAPYGKLFVATDNGIFIWYDGRVVRYVGRSEGIGTSEIVRTINYDTDNRVWFSTSGYVGYYMEIPQNETLITIEMVVPATTASPAGTVTQPLSPTITQITTTPTQKEPSTVISPIAGIISSVADPVVQAIKALVSVFCIK
jgi:ligand-binding sensor domain-containing protein